MQDNANSIFLLINDDFQCATKSLLPKIGDLTISPRYRRSKVGQLKVPLWLLVDIGSLL